MDNKRNRSNSSPSSSSNSTSPEKKRPRICSQKNILKILKCRETSSKSVKTYLDIMPREGTEIIFYNAYNIKNFTIDNLIKYMKERSLKLYYLKNNF